MRPDFALLRSSPSYQSDLDEVHRVIGLGLTRWQYVETALYLIAHCFLDTGHENSRIAFFQMRTAEKKLEFVDALARAHLSQWVRVNRWRPISKDVREAISFRNALAHFEVFHLAPEHMALMEPPTSFSAFLSGHHLAYRDESQNTVRAMSVELIRANADDLKLLTERVLGFVRFHVPQMRSGVDRLPENLRTWLSWESP